MRGFSLIELLIYSSLVALIIVFSALFAISIMKATSKSSIREEVQRNAANILRIFDFGVRHAQSIYIPTSDFLGNPGRISLATTSYPPEDEEITYTDLYIHDGQFCVKRELTGVFCITSSNVEVTSLVFSRLVQSGGQESAQIRFTIRYDHPNAEFQLPLTVETSARLRSY